MPWTILKKVIATMQPKTIGDLRTASIAGWETVKQSTVDKLCGSFPSRLQMFLEDR
jgi:hypothetical protein